MLVLTRKRDESIVIGDDIEIFVVEIRGDKVRLGVEAPHSVPVHRKEVYEAIQRHNQNMEPAAIAPAAPVKDDLHKSMKPSSPELDDQFPVQPSPGSGGDEGTESRSVSKDGRCDPVKTLGDSGWEN